MTLPHPILLGPPKYSQGSYGIQGEKLMVGPSTCLPLDPTENPWSITKQDAYADGHQFTSNGILWVILKTTSGINK